MAIAMKPHGCVIFLVVRNTLVEVGKFLYQQIECSCIHFLFVAQGTQADAGPPQASALHSIHPSFLCLLLIRTCFLVTSS